MLNGEVFSAGDLFELQMYTVNNGADVIRQVYIILDVFGSYWFWPSWTPFPPAIDYDLRDIRHGISQTEEIIAFTVPDGVSPVAGIVFWGGMLKPNTAILWGRVARVEFGFEF